MNKEVETKEEETEEEYYCDACQDTGYIEIMGEILCAIDWQGGEMKFKLNFIN